MNRGWHLFTFKQIPVYMHWSFSLIILYILYLSYQSGLDIAGTMWLGGVILAIFSCVVLHEYGHALAARRYGIQTKDIILTPIGGIARLQSIPNKPIQELVVALAGPAVNVIISVVLGVIIFSFSEYFITFEPITLDAFGFNHFIYTLFYGNLILAAFNMIPAFPMDGGRVLRSMLALRWKRTTATKWASYIGRTIAVLFIIYGVYYGHYMMIFVGIFVFVNAGIEYKHLRLEDILETHTVQDLYQPTFNRVNASFPLKDIESKSINDYLVFNEFNQLVGLLSPVHVQEAQKQNSNEMVIQRTLEKIVPIALHDQIKKAFYLMKANRVYTLPVYENNQLIGALHYQDILKKV